MPGGFIQVGTPEWEAYLKRERVPVFPVCTPNVAHPTISVRPNRLGGESVVVQWFGEATGVQLGERQFHFPLSGGVDTLEWFDRPEAFRVAFLGQLKDWPNQDAIREFGPGFGPDAWVFWVVSSMYATKRASGGNNCASFVGQVILLGDPEVGPITPKLYSEPRVADEEQAKVEH